MVALRYRFNPSRLTDDGIEEFKEPMSNAPHPSQDHATYIYQSLGTLCDEPNCLTCSFDAARRWNKARHLYPYRTFELAAEAVRSGEIEAFLVPGAYPQISYFIMDSALTVSDTFVMQIPPLVLVGVDSVAPRESDVLYHHPATTPLLSDIDIKYNTHEPVTSNSRACAALLEKPEHSVAITNRLCADHFRLNVYKTLRAGIQMPWICFVKASQTQV